ncbi:MAG: hypothetical protein H7X71_00565 [Chitinophagales bacterium]|nr:hypothetical protein [Chitinophagales bacterium]
MKSHIFAFLLLCVSLKGYNQTLDGTRSVNWELAGLKNNCIFPSVTLNFISAGGVADGITPNDDVLNDLLNSLEEGVITMIYFPDGIYLFKEPVTLKENVILRGESGESTVLQFDLDVEDDLITVEGSVTGTEAVIAENITKDDTTLRVIDPGIFEAGGYIKLTEDDVTLVTSDWALNTTGQIIRIDSVAGDVFFLSSPVRRNFYTSRNAKVKRVKLIENVAIESLKIIRLDITDKQTSNIVFTYALNCSVRSVQSFKCNYAHVEIHNSSNMEISGCYFKDAFTYGSGGKAYGVLVHYNSGECLIRNNIFNHLRHSMVVQAGANGNVFAYNYSINPFWTGVLLPSNSAGDIVLHGNYPYANLFEGNNVQNIVIDDSHGANGMYNTFFRNRADLYGIVMSSSAAGNDQNFIGNEVTNTDFLKGLYTLYGTGHFQYGNNIKGTVTPAGTETLPENSLFMNSVPEYYALFSSWPPLGIPNSLNEYDIEAKTRYNAGVLTQYTGCMERTITPQDFAVSSMCEGDTIQVTYTTSGDFNADNVFTAYLLSGDGTGTMYIIGSDTVELMNSIEGVVPTVEPGAYFVRVDASSPLTTGTLSLSPIFLSDTANFTHHINLQAGENYILPSGDTVSSAGTYITSLLTIYGCDSIITDIITIEESCIAPASSMISNLGPDHAKVKWTPVTGALFYQISYRKSGTTGWTIIPSVSTGKMLSALSPSSLYQYRIRAKCTTGFGPYTSPQTFTTLALRIAGDTENLPAPFTVSPNPANGLFTLRCEHIEEEIIYVRVYDIRGDLLFHKSYFSAGNNFEEQVQLQDFAEGIAIIKINSASMLTSIPLILMK